jgi:alpha-beta hydrolase superfamily lysophospholipase
MASFADLRLRIAIMIAKRLIQFRDDAIQSAPQPHPPHTQLQIPTPQGSLQGRLSIPTTPPQAAVLLFHGIGDRLHYWHQAQSLLAQHEIASLIYHHPGYGSSPGPFHLENLTQAAQSAYTHLRKSLPPKTPIFLLGFSMGTAIASDAAGTLTPTPAGLILCQPFSTLRDAATSVTRIPLAARLLPNIWRTADNLPHLKLPILLVHSDADRLFPLHHAHTLHAACPPSTRLAIPTGFSHSAGALNPTLAYWQPILTFIAQALE